MTSNIIPNGVADILSSVFDLPNNFSPNLMKHFQEIINTIEANISIIPDEDPGFVPLSMNASRYQVINESGLRELKSM